MTKVKFYGIKLVIIIRRLRCQTKKIKQINDQELEKKIKEGEEMLMEEMEDLMHEDLDALWEDMKKYHDGFVRQFGQDYGGPEVALNYVDNFIAMGGLSHKVVDKWLLVVFRLQLTSDLKDVMQGLKEEFKNAVDFLAKDRRRVYKATPRELVEMFWKEMNDEEREQFGALVAGMLSVIAEVVKGGSKVADNSFVASIIAYFELLYGLFSDYWPKGLAMMLSRGWDSVVESFIFKLGMAIIHASIIDTDVETKKKSTAKKKSNAKSSSTTKLKEVKTKKQVKKTKVNASSKKEEEIDTDVVDAMVDKVFFGKVLH